MLKLYDFGFERGSAKPYDEEHEVQVVLHGEHAKYSRREFSCRTLASLRGLRNLGLCMGVIRAECTYDFGLLDSSADSGSIQME